LELDKDGFCNKTKSLFAKEMENAMFKKSLPRNNKEA
jgi:hypothetical protein